jgi:uncharacterized protein YjgD (DUF1641 family)
MQEDFNEEFEESFNIETILKDTRMQEILYDLKLKLANENYDMIIKNGIDVHEMIYRGISVVPLINTLNDMLAIFEDLEEYEKCAKIKKILDEVNKGA